MKIREAMARLIGETLEVTEPFHRKFDIPKLEHLSSAVNR